MSLYREGRFIATAFNILLSGAGEDLPDEISGAVGGPLHTSGMIEAYRRYEVKRSDCKFATGRGPTF